MSTLSPDELMVKASQSRRDNRLSEALGEAEEAASLYRLAGVQAGVARAIAFAGQVARDEGRTADALAHYQEAVAIYRDENAPLRLAHAVRHLADIYRELEDVDLASGCYEEALALYRENERTSSLDFANAIRGFALLKDANQDPEGARVLWEEACAIYTTSGVKDGVAECATRLRK